MKIYAIAAMDEGRVIGHNGDLPWDHPEDMQRFKDLTRGFPVVMGRKTYESLPDGFRPLPNRTNLVVTRNPKSLERESEIELVEDLKGFLSDCQRNESAFGSDTLWVIGGEQIYRESLPFVDEVYLTKIYGTHHGDTYFPEFENDFELVDEDGREAFTFLRFVRKSSGVAD